MVEYEYKEVYFDQYCHKCKHEKLKDIDSPCDECLEEPVNSYTHRPVKFEDKES